MRLQLGGCALDLVARLNLRSAKRTEKNRLIEPAHALVRLDATNGQVQHASVFPHEQKSLLRQGERFAHVLAACPEHFVLSHDGSNPIWKMRVVACDFRGGLLVRGHVPDDDIMPLFCPTEQDPIRKRRNPLIRLGSATVHGVVFDFLIEMGRGCRKASMTIRNR